MHKRNTILEGSERSLQEPSLHRIHCCRLGGWDREEASIEEGGILLDEMTSPVGKLELSRGQITLIYHVQWIKRAPQVPKLTHSVELFRRVVEAIYLESIGGEFSHGTPPFDHDTPEFLA